MSQESLLPNIAKQKATLNKQDSMGSHYGSEYFHNVKLNHNTPRSNEGTIIEKENIQTGTVSLSFERFLLSMLFIDIGTQLLLEIKTKRSNWQY
jgi:hypothetical protein